MKKCVKASLIFMCIFLYLNGCSGKNGFNGKNNKNATKDKTAQTAAAEIQSTPQIEKPVTPQTQDQLPVEKVVAAGSIQEGEKLLKSDDILGRLGVKRESCPKFEHYMQDSYHGCKIFAFEGGFSDEYCGFHGVSLQPIVANAPNMEISIQACRKRCEEQPAAIAKHYQGYKNPVFLCLIQFAVVDNQASKGSEIKSYFHQVIGVKNSAEK